MASPARLRIGRPCATSLTACRLGRGSSSWLISAVAHAVAASWRFSGGCGFRIANDGWPCSGPADVSASPLGPMTSLVLAFDRQDNPVQDASGRPGRAVLNRVVRHLLAPPLELSSSREGQEGKSFRISGKETQRGRGWGFSPAYNPRQISGASGSIFPGRIRPPFSI
jgi:hypothetical protein